MKAGDHVDIIDGRFKGMHGKVKSLHDTFKGYVTVSRRDVDDWDVPLLAVPIGNCKVRNEEKTA